MKPSLSVILPVCNAAESLGRVVLRLLDTLPDLTGSFEIIIVDDASTDHTLDIVSELKRTYPQVRLVRHGWTWGTSAALRTGRLEARGQHVIVIPSLADFQLREMVRQWNRLRSVPTNECHLPPNADDAARSPMLRRAEPAHDETRHQREPSFLRHLRQLSAWGE